MKQLVKNIDDTGLFFDDNASLEDVCDWLSVQTHTGNNILKLECSYSSKFSILNNIIIVSSDDDYIELQLEEVETITLDKL